MHSSCTRILSALALIAALAMPLAGQSSSSSSAAPRAASVSLSPAEDALTVHRWNWGAFFSGGVGTGSERNGYHFLSAGVRGGKVLTNPVGPGLLRGQFEYSAELMPWWQANTPRFQRYFLTATGTPGRVAIAGPFPTGGTYDGVSITPIILRWDLAPHGRWVPFAQGAGGLIWTNHKFPPVGPFNTPGHQGTSAWNFTPQFGVGFQYFLKPQRSITFNANAVHISNASLGDSNPGVNASVQFQLGYSWWK